MVVLQRASWVTLVSTGVSSAPLPTMCTQTVGKLCPEFPWQPEQLVLMTHLNSPRACTAKLAGSQGRLVNDCLAVALEAWLINAPLGLTAFLKKKKKKVLRSCFLFIFIFVCTGSSLLLVAFFQLQSPSSRAHCSVWAQLPMRQLSYWSRDQTRLLHWQADS